MEKLQEGHVVIFPLAAVWHLQKLWVSPLTAISQAGRKPRLIYNFLWIGLNKLVKSAAQKEPMHFGKGSTLAIRLHSSCRPGTRPNLHL